MAYDPSGHVRRVKKGNKYYSYTWYSKKVDAERMAKRIRAAGMKATITKTSNPKGYALWSPAK